jgi:PilZ domain
MFERTFSSCRNSAGEANGDPGADRASSSADQRRSWLRYRVNMETSVQLPNSAMRDVLHASIRDISRGGVNLIVDRNVPAGQLLNLDLPRDDDRGYTALACVVRSKEMGKGQWALGCVFSRELTDEDLTAFATRQVGSTDNRQRPRFDCDLQATYQMIGEAGLAEDALQVSNLSASGVGLTVDRFIDAGVLLSVELRGKDETAVRSILSCVVHVTKQSERRWTLGCNFIRELGDEDLLALI